MQEQKKPQVVLAETPTEKIVNRQNIFKFTDSDLREIVLSEPNILDHYDFMKALGKDSENMSCVAMASPLIYINSINGEHFKKPQTSGEIRAGLKRVGTKGLREITENLLSSGLISNPGSKEEEVEELKK